MQVFHTKHSKPLHCEDCVFQYFGLVVHSLEKKGDNHLFPSTVIMSLTDAQAQLGNGVIDVVCCIILGGSSVFLVLSAFDIGIFKVRETPRGAKRPTWNRFRKMPATIHFAILATLFGFISSLSQSVRKFATWDTSDASQLWCDVVTRLSFLAYCFSKSLTLGFLGARAMSVFDNFNILRSSSCFSKKFAFYFSLTFGLFDAALGLSGVLDGGNLGNVFMNPGVCIAYTFSLWMWIMSGSDFISAIVLMIIFVAPLVEVANNARERRGDSELSNLARDYIFVGGVTAILAFVCSMVISFSHTFPESSQLFAGVLFIVDLTANTLMQLYGTRGYFQLKPAQTSPRGELLEMNLIHEKTAKPAVKENLQDFRIEQPLLKSSKDSTGKFESTVAVANVSSPQLSSTRSPELSQTLSVSQPPS
jgi:hypothetical protein